MHNRGKEAYIKLKMNSISDFKMTDKLYEASNAGIKNSIDYQRNMLFDSRRERFE